MALAGDSSEAGIADSFIRECELYAADQTTLKKNGPAIIESLDFSNLAAIRLSAVHVLEQIEGGTISISDICYYPCGRNKGPVQILTDVHVLRAFAEYRSNVKPKIGICYTKGKH